MLLYFFGAVATLRETSYDLAVVDTPGVDRPLDRGRYAGGGPMPRPLQADGDRSAGMPADGAKPHPSCLISCSQSEPAGGLSTRRG
jgi:hypothetical protein